MCEVREEIIWRRCFVHRSVAETKIQEEVLKCAVLKCLGFKAKLSSSLTN